jgi:hypothetical protein
MQSMTQRSQIASFALSMLAAALTACGGGTDTPTPNPTTAVTTAAATSTADGVQETTPPAPAVNVAPTGCIAVADLTDADVGKPFRSWLLRSRLNRQEVRFPPDRALELSYPDQDTGFTGWDVVAYCFDPPNI